MTYQKHVTADVGVPTPVDPAEPFTLNFQIPDPQKQALYQAIMTLVTVVLGIAMTLVAQVVGQAMDVAPPEPVPIVDQMQTLAGTTHFTEIALEEDLVVGGTFTLDGNTYTATDPITITGVLTDVVLLYLQN